MKFVIDLKGIAKQAERMWQFMGDRKANEGRILSVKI